MSVFTLLSSLEWRQPLWLLLMLQPLLLWLLIRFKHSRTNNQFADKHLLPWVQVNNEKSLVQTILSRDSAYFLAMALLAIAMAGPRTPLETTDAKQAPALDIMLVVDVSASMKAGDIKPSRLQRGVQELYELLSRIERDDVRFGSIVYAARPHVFVPVTNDIDALKFYLKDLDKLVLPTTGSDASAALLMARQELIANKALSFKTNKKQAQAILWLTDGDIANEQDKARIQTTLKSLQKDSLPVFILGLGTAEGGAIPLRTGGWLEHNGQGVISKMDDELLTKFAKLGGGKFSKSYDDESEWELLYNEGLLGSVKQTINTPSKNDDQQWVVYYQWFLLAGMMLLLIALVPFKLKRSKNQSQSVTSFIVGTVLIALWFSPAAEVQAKENLIHSGLSAVLTESIKNYNNEEYALATSGFMATILQAQSDSERGKALHNLGNNYFQQGDYESAAQLFTDALRYAPNQTQSKNNLTLTNELNALLQRRQRKGAARRAKQATGRQQLGNQNQSDAMLENKTIRPKNLKLPEIPKEHLNNLLSKGLAHLKMLESNDAKKERERQRNIEQARISLLRDQDNSLFMWKRLFEVEEGFPARLEKPKTVPGQLPW